MILIDSCAGSSFGFVINLVNPSARRIAGAGAVR
jgi:hypothetical protein